MRGASSHVPYGQRCRIAVSIFVVHALQSKTEQSDVCVLVFWRLIASARDYFTIAKT